MKKKSECVWELDNRRQNELYEYHPECCKYLSEYFKHLLPSKAKCPYCGRKIKERENVKNDN